MQEAVAYDPAKHTIEIEVPTGKEKICAINIRRKTDLHSYLMDPESTYPVQISPNDQAQKDLDKLRSAYAKSEEIDYTQLPNTWRPRDEINYNFRSPDKTHYHFYERPYSFTYWCPCGEIEELDHLIVKEEEKSDSST